MAEEKLLTVREVGEILNITEKDVMDLAESGEVPAYKVGGVYLRFKPDQVMEYKKILRKKPGHQAGGNVSYSFRNKIGDFFYFNDFYIFSIFIVLLIIVIIWRGY